MAKTLPNVPKKIHIHWGVITKQQKHELVIQEDSIGEKERWRLSIHNGGHQLQYQAGIRSSAGLVYFYILISYQDSQPPPPCVQPAITTLPLFFLFSTSEYSNSFLTMSPSSDFSNLSREHVPH